MKDEDLVRELARRTGVGEDAVQAVLRALADRDREERAPLPSGTQIFYTEDPREVDELIERARAHPLGIDFLVRGHLASVAATFQTHAFTVEAARLRLG
jgi:hypothetical protein